MINIKKLDNKDIYVFDTPKSINEVDAENFLDKIESIATKENPIKMMGILESFPKLESFMTLFEMMKLKTKVMPLISKYALITDKDWIENMIPIADFFTHMEIKQFDLDEEDEAIDWLEKN